MTPEEEYNLLEDVRGMQEEMGRMAFRLNYLENQLPPDSRKRALDRIEAFREEERKNRHG